MKSGEELYNKVFESPRSSRELVLPPALHEGRQDTTSIEERASKQSAGRSAAVKSTIGFKGYSILHTQGSSQKVDSSIRNGSKSRGVETRPEENSSVQSIQRKIGKSDP